MGYVIMKSLKKSLENGPRHSFSYILASPVLTLKPPKKIVYQVGITNHMDNGSAVTAIRTYPDFPDVLFCFVIEQMKIGSQIAEKGNQLVLEVPLHCEFVKKKHCTDENGLTR